MGGKSKADIELIAMRIRNGREVVEQARLPVLRVKQLETVLKQPVEALATGCGQATGSFMKAQWQAERKRLAAFIGSDLRHRILMSRIETVNTDPLNSAFTTHLPQRAVDGA